MKKICIYLLLAATLLGLCACGSDPAPDMTQPGDTQTSAPDTQPAETGKTEDTTMEETTEYVKTEEPKTVPESLKLLAIGNSFSTDCMEYLWKMLRDAGVKNITLGNLYYGVCTMAEHLSFATNDSASYTYYKSTKGTWIVSKSYKMSTALAEEDWDIITLQESSKTCGVDSAFKASYKKLVDYVRSKNTTAKLVWNMTWAYQQDSTHSAFPNYGNDQMKMYNMLIDCVKNYPLKDENVSYIIPVGTAVQNARTSFLGDHLTRDGYHLNKDYGRYLAALTWTCAITGVDPATIKYNPASMVITADMVKVACEAITAAIKTPYAVTESTIKTGEGSLGGTAETSVTDPAEILNPEDFYEADKAIAAKNNVNLDNYTLLKWEYLGNTYWNCTSKAGTTTPGSGGSTYNQNVCTKEKYSLTDVPLGTVFICDAGWQYRIELFNNTTDKFTGSRPALTTIEFFELNSDFMQGAKYLTWNIAASPKADISAIFAQAAVHLRVYVPKK